MRKYEPIWQTLKAEGSCTITAPRALHPRIIKAVIKLKNEDLGFKLLNSEQFKKPRLQKKVSGSVITFSLAKNIGLGDI